MSQPSSISRELVQTFLKAVQHGALHSPEELSLHIMHTLCSPQPQLGDLVMAANSHGDTAFLMAARHGHLALIRRMREEFSVPLEQSNSDGKTALHEAAQAGHVKCVRYLLECGAQVDSLKRGDWTPLMLACTKNSLPMVQILVENEASLLLANKDGWTPFHISCREGHTDIISYLLHTSPECWNTISKNGRTPLHTVALHGRLSAVEVLLTRGGYNSIDSRDSCRVTPLMDAARGNHIEMLSLLLYYTASLSCEDEMGRQAIHHASQAGADEALQLLLKHGSKVNHKASATGLTPLHYAAKECHTSTLSLLLSSGADPTLTDRGGRTALDTAKHVRGGVEAVCLLQRSAPAP